MSKAPKITRTDSAMETPYIPPIDDAQVDDNVAGIFKEIHKYYGFVPNLYKTLAYYPPLLKANWQKIRAVMGGGSLSAKIKEAIAVTISQANDCEYCVRIHSGMLRNLQIPEDEILALMRLNWDKVHFLDGKEKALVRFTHKVNASAPMVEKEDVQELLDAGASYGEIVHALGVMEVYISYNKVLVALRVEMERRDRAKKLSYPPFY